MGLFLLCAALRYGAARDLGVKLPLPAYAHPELGPDGADLAVRYYHTLYFASTARLGNLATGVLLALCMLNDNVSAVSLLLLPSLLFACQIKFY